MIVLDSNKSDAIRQKYIETFVDTESKYYAEKIEKRIEFSDGLCYIGYLWDCLKKPNVVSEDELEKVLKDKKCFYIMWDIHSADRILIPDYWKYPKSSILVTDNWSSEIKSELPEDIYMFDDTFTWSAVYTHETDAKENPYCIYLSKQVKSNV